MDSALQELLLSEKGPDEIVEVLVRLTDKNVIPEKLTPIAQFGDVLTCRIRRGDILEVYRSNLTKSMKAPRFIAYDDSFVPEFTYSNQSTEASSLTKASGKNTVVAVMDWGIDFAHPNFRNPDGTTRLLAIWDQSFKDAKGLAPYGYGRLFTRDQINQALKSKTPYRSLRYHPGKSDSSGGGTHGTHVMDIAAGNGTLGNKGAASEADLIFVHLASRGTSGTANLGDSVRILEALDAIRTLANDRPLAVNISVGRHGGPHDGQTLVEQGIDNFLKERNNTMVCQSTGNYFQALTHHSDIVRPGKTKTFSFVIDPADTTLNEMEIWYPGSDLFSIELINNRSSKSFACPVNSKKDIILNGKFVGRIYHRDKEPNNGKNHINLFLYKNAPSGRWTVKLKGEKVFDGRYHTWIERDGSCRKCQSRFDPSFAVSNSTTGTIANGFNSISCGAYDTSSTSFRIAPFSSKGPTLDGRFKPDILAPGVSIRAAKSTPVTSNLPRPSTTTMSGTSMAAPRVTGVTALVLEVLPKNTPFWQIRNIIIGSADPILGADASRTGSGKLNTVKAIRAAKKYAETRRILQRVLEPFGRLNTFRIPPVLDVAPAVKRHDDMYAEAFETHFNRSEVRVQNSGMAESVAEAPVFLQEADEALDFNETLDVEKTTFSPSYLSKIFVVSNSNAVLRDATMAPKKIQNATSEFGRNSQGNAILIKGKGYQILNAMPTSSKNIVAQVATVAQPAIAVGWTVASNFSGNLYNESLALKPASTPISTDPTAFTIVNSNAIIRNPNTDFSSTDKRIPLGSMVQFLRSDQSGRYAQVAIKHHPSNTSSNGVSIWTAVSNLQKGWLNIFDANSAWRRGKYIGALNLVDVVGSRMRIKQVASDTLSAYQNLCNSALAHGVVITLNSGFRSYPKQAELYRKYKQGVPGYNLAARPGRSNHQNGIAFDLNTTGKKATGWGPVYEWLKKNATSHGFFRTVRSEHWHWVYHPNKARQLAQQGKYRSWMLRKSSEWLESGFMAMEEDGLPQENLFQNSLQIANTDFEIDDKGFESQELFFNELGDPSHFVDSSVEVVKNLAKAIRANRRYGISIGWNVHHDKINDLLLPFSGLQNVSLTEDSFVHALSNWQKSKGFSSDDADGILGPKTWQLMKGELAITTTQHSTVAIASATAPNEWNTLPNIRSKYTSLHAYLTKRAEVVSWGVTHPASYIEAAITEWNGSPKVHRYFGSFDGDPHKSYLNLKRLYAKKGIPNPAQYISSSIRQLTFFGKSSPGHIDLKEKLANAEQRLRASGHNFNLENAWSFVPRTFNSSIHKLSKHAIGKAIDINHQSNPHITSKDEIQIIKAVCNTILVNGFLKERDPDVFLRASNHFQATFNNHWISQQTDAHILAVLRSKSRMKKLEKYARLGFCTLPSSMVRALQNAGLSWGGAWSSSKDFMHFETT